MGSVASEFRDRLFRTVIVNKRLADCSGGDEGRGGGIVEHARQAEAGFVEAGDCIVCEERVRSANQCEMMAQVLGGFAEVHGSDLITGGDPLIER